MLWQLKNRRTLAYGKSLVWKAIGLLFRGNDKRSE